MRHLDLFSGIGGFAYAAQQVWGDEHEVVAFCEIDKFCQKVLKKHWPNTEIIEDVRDNKLREYKNIDLLTGGFPCQDLSFAGKQAGFNGTRSSLYREMLQCISTIQPGYVIFENVSALLVGENGRWFRQFLTDLAKVRYDAQWHCIPASSINSPHHRDRCWIVAYPYKDECVIERESKSWRIAQQLNREIIRASSSRWPTEPNILRMVDGIPNQLDRLGACGNAIVPQVAMVIMQAIKEVESQ